MKKIIYILVVLMILSGCSANAVEKKMLLIGGGLKFCTSYAQSNCTEELSFDESAYSSTYFSVSKEKFKIIKRNQFDVFSNQETFNSIVELLKKYQVRFDDSSVSRRTLLKRLDNLKLSSNGQMGRQLLDSLNSNERNFVFHHLQDPVTDNKGKALTEYVVLDKSHPDSVRIIEKFVAMVKATSAQSRPVILFSTASANDIFDAASFYLQLFRSFEVEAIWLPIEASLNRVMTDPHLSCEQLPEVRAKEYAVFNREKTYPQLSNYQQKFCNNPQFFKTVISQANGIFFNGGDQFLTLSAMADTRRGKREFNAFYQQLKDKFDRGQLVVAGTSAGTAVQSGGQLSTQKTIPMITNGESIKGFFNGAYSTDSPPSSLCESLGNCGENISADSLTYFQAGGFDFLPIGILDTHFAERDRSFRMIRLLKSTGQSLGYGVDENTALVVNYNDGKVSMSTVGEGAVWHFVVSQSVSISAVYDAEKTLPVEQRLGNDVLAQTIQKALNNEKRVATGVVRHQAKSKSYHIQVDSTANSLQIDMALGNGR